MRNLSECVYYQILLRAFTPEGTLDAGFKMLPHIASLGVDVIFLCPVTTADADADKSHWSHRALTSGFDNPNNPYRMLDYERIDPEYGTDESLERFVSEAHRLGMRVLLDAVYYHCGPNCAIIKEHPEFCLRNENGEIERGMFNMVRFDFEHRGVRKYFTDNMRYFVERFDVDGYRCDCGDWMPADFWEEAVAEVKKSKPSLLMLNEGHSTEHLRQAFQTDYGVTWSDKLVALNRGEGMSTEQIISELEKDAKRLLPGRYALRGLENHDFVNDAKEERAERVLPPDAIESALTVNFLLDGVPYLYNGVEIADTNRHSIFSNRFFGKREWINWANALTPVGQKRLDFVRELCCLRHTEKTITEGTVTFYHDVPNGVIAFERSFKGMRVWVCANLLSKPVSVSAPFALGEAHVLLSREAARSGETLHLGSYGFCAVRV